MKKKYLSRKEEIIVTTISLIHELGVNKVSMKDIGRREGVTEASLYKHFKNKEELLSAVLDYFEQYDEHIHATLKQSKLDAAEGILQYFSIYADYYNNYKEVTSLINTYDALSHDKYFEQRGSELCKVRNEFLREFIEKGQQCKEIKNDITAEDLSYILFGTFQFIIAMWRWKEYSFSLPDKVKEIIGSLLENYTL